MNKRVLVVERLKQLGLAQTEIAERIRRSQPAISDWFSGKALPDRESLARLVWAYPQLGPLALEALVEVEATESSTQELQEVPVEQPA